MLECNRSPRTCSWSTFYLVLDFGLAWSTSLPVLSFQEYMIMCIDTPESTTNSLSSGFNVDARWHLCSEGEKNAALSCNFNFNTLFGQLPRCFAGTLLLPLCLLLRPIQILEHWGHAHEVHLDRYNRARDFGLEF